MPPEPHGAPPRIIRAALIRETQRHVACACSKRPGCQRAPVTNVAEPQAHSVAPAGPGAIHQASQRDRAATAVDAATVRDPPPIERSPRTGRSRPLGADVSMPSTNWVL